MLYWEKNLVESLSETIEYANQLGINGTTNQIIGNIFTTLRKK